MVMNFCYLDLGHLGEIIQILKVWKRSKAGDSIARTEIHSPGFHMTKKKQLKCYYLSLIRHYKLSLLRERISVMQWLAPVG